MYYRLDLEEFVRKLSYTETRNLVADLAGILKLGNFYSNLEEFQLKEWLLSTLNKCEAGLLPFPISKLENLILDVLLS